MPGRREGNLRVASGDMGRVIRGEARICAVGLSNTKRKTINTPNKNQQGNHQQFQEPD